MSDVSSSGTVEIYGGRIKGGTITLGGSGNGNGQVIVKNASGTTITTINNSGISTNSLTASDYIYCDGTVNSYFKLPMASTVNNGYVEIASNGFHIFYKNSGELYIDEQGVLVFNQTNTYGQYHTEFSQQSLVINNYKDSNNYRHGAAMSTSRVSVSRKVSGSSGSGDNSYMDKGEIYASVSISTSGSKPRIVDTKNFSKIRLCAYEMPTPMFGDIGDGIIDTDGKAYIFIDPIFADTVCMELQYQVFLQKYGSGDCYVSERHEGFFIVEGTPGLIFGWEIKARQIDYDQWRFERFEHPEERVDVLMENNTSDSAATFITEHFKEMIE